ncbi:hypothetical protein CEXT_199371 [Caerostris extrusa]|uniref:Uncharacterized protein n=1 Tax=Caerostris extrusa TaxID=172846 RepID=A0AAV4WV14_CAEEX|nr:hypothetical protein CEXT_199371 [Caerostris extrusa]
MISDECDEDEQLKNSISGASFDAEGGGGGEMVPIPSLKDPFYSENINSNNAKHQATTKGKKGEGGCGMKRDSIPAKEGDVRGDISPQEEAFLAKWFLMNAMKTNNSALISAASFDAEGWGGGDGSNSIPQGPFHSENNINSNNAKHQATTLS